MTVPREFLLLVLLFSLTVLSVTPVAAQVSATDLSYFPLHIGDVWVYQVSTYTPHEPKWTPRDTIRVEVTGDSLYPNGKRYFVFNSGGPLRVDSTDGRVYAPRPNPPQRTSQSGRIPLLRGKFCTSPSPRDRQAPWNCTMRSAANGCPGRSADRRRFPQQAFPRGCTSSGCEVRMKWSWRKW